VSAFSAIDRALVQLKPPVLPQPPAPRPWETPLYPADPRDILIPSAEPLPPIVLSPIDRQSAIESIFATVEGMRPKVNALGGSITITPAGEGGAAIELKIPLK